MTKKRILITGGCGFIGCNTAARFAAQGHAVSVYDDLSRPLTELNLEWLQQQADITFFRADIRDRARLGEVIKEGKFDAIFHLAAQVAVTTSITDPAHDFEVNAAGTFNVLEGVRRHSPETIVVYSSTNKVYGKLATVSIEEREHRYVTPDLLQGVNEAQSLDFHSPYGCSKGAADQYVVDYARIYGVPTVCLRQSCIYGRRQFGVEDQGWVAWFTIAHATGRPITIYGNGKQVRDVLFVDDLVDCYVACLERIENIAGQAFNIGGGPQNSLSLLEFVTILEETTGMPLKYSFSTWRPGDQPFYVSDIRKAEAMVGWRPRTSARDGIRELVTWVGANRQAFSIQAAP